LLAKAIFIQISQNWNVILNGTMLGTSEPDPKGAIPGLNFSSKLFTTSYLTNPDRFLRGQRWTSRDIKSGM